jgi:glycosyltransferase involved in cell wall biosynthesis
MKILIVTESIPFPAYNGRELPIEGIFLQLSLKHTVHLIVVSGDEQTSKDISNIPPTIHFAGYIKPKKWNITKRLFKTLTSLRYTLSPFDFSKKNIIKVINDETYDFLWISPVSYHGFATFCRKNNLLFFKKTAIGLNDSKTYLYRDPMNEILSTGIFNWSYFIHWLLSFLITPEEKKYLAITDLVHVQTQHEHDKVKPMLNTSSKAKIIVAPNGIKEELFRCSYKGVDSDQILFMTHLEGGRAEESKWFIKKVWRIIHKKLPDAKLLLVGKPPRKKIAYIDAGQNIIVNGYAENLSEVFNNVRLAVVPIFHSTGLINRISDAMTAGIPVVSTPQAIATFSGIKVGEQIIAAATANAFACTIIELYTNKTCRLNIARQARQYALQLPTWNNAAKKIESAMEELID